MDTSRGITTSWKWQDELRNSPSTSHSVGLPTRESKTSLKSVRLNANKGSKGLQPQRIPDSRDNHRAQMEFTPTRPIVVKPLRRSRTASAELEPIPESYGGKVMKDREFLNNPRYIVPLRSISKSKAVGTSLKERMIEDEKSLEMVKEKNFKNLELSKNSYTTLEQGMEHLFLDFPETDEQIVDAIELQDGLIQKAFKKKSKNAKLTMVHVMTVILFTLVLLMPINLANPLEGAALFNKQQRMDKLISTNQIGYHFKKVIREVADELFVSRRLDISTLFLGVQVMRETSIDVANFCKHLSDADISTERSKTSFTDYIYIQTPALASFAEAKARCQARNLQLPEVYSPFQLDQLSTFLRANKISKCFAGLEPDILDSIYRFISTGFPIWKTPHTTAYSKHGNILPIEGIMDDLNVKFMYGDDNKLYARFTNPHILTNTKFQLADYKYRDSVKEFQQWVAPIVCETKWDGLLYENIRVDNHTVYDFMVKSVEKRSVDVDSSNKGQLTMNLSFVDIDSSNKGQSIVNKNFVNIDSSNKGQSIVDKRSAKSEAEGIGELLVVSTTLKEYCVSIADRAAEIHTEMSAKLINLLSLVDISVQLESNSQLQKSKREISEFVNSSLGNETMDFKLREKRYAFLAKFIFSTGVKLIWNLFGFVQKMRTEKRIKNLENSLFNTQTQVKDNSDTIRNMSMIVSNNSLAIDKLVLSTLDLTWRMIQIELKVDQLSSRVIGIANQQENLHKLSLVDSLIDRILQSMNSGYDILKDIIHCSLLGQTSPLLLPPDQIELVQNEVRKVSTGLLDTDFAKMQSVVVSDPSDPHLLLVVINVAALSRREGELVKMVPIPQYEGEMTLSPVLDYDTIILDQLTRKYFILSEQEEYDCLFSRCYISDVERSVDQSTCGIPQLFDQHLDACSFESNPANGGDGVFIKPMLPDGILFSFKGEVSTQLFCKDNSEIGVVRKLQGAGIMQLPNGCVLSVTDKLGKNTKVKGQPLYRAIAAGDITLVMNGPLTAIQTGSSLNDSLRRKTTEGLITSHLFPVVQQMKTVDARVEHQDQLILILWATLGVTGLIILVIILATFRSSKKFWKKIYELRERFANIIEQVTSLGELRDRIRRGLNPPTFPRLENPIFSPRTRPRALQDEEAMDMRDSVPPYCSMENVTPCPAPRFMLENSTFNTYRNMDPTRALPRVPYPDLDQPLLDQVALDRESKEVYELCDKYPKEKEKK